MMNRTPSLWRAWSPVVFQVTGVLFAVAGSQCFPTALQAIALAAGVSLWIFGFTHGTRLSKRLRSPKRVVPPIVLPPELAQARFPHLSKALTSAPLVVMPWTFFLIFLCSWTPIPTAKVILAFFSFYFIIQMLCVVDRWGYRPAKYAGHCEKCGYDLRVTPNPLPRVRDTAVEVKMTCGTGFQPVLRTYPDLHL